MNAALGNGLASTWNELDDGYTRTAVHPGALSQPLILAAGQAQGSGGGIESQDRATGPHPRGHQQRQIAGAAAEIHQLLPGAWLQPQQRLAFPEAMQPQAQQVVELVVAGGDGLEQGADRRRITGLHRCWPG